jgi:AmiR/NasT family two-component response regulator
MFTIEDLAWTPTVGNQSELEALRLEVEHLRAALASRHHIGMAEGMLMAGYGVSEDAAFAYLARRSQNDNMKLRLVAERVIQELSAGHRLSDPAANGLHGA